MRAFRAFLALLMIMIATSIAIAAEKALCLVCHVKEGESAVETVKATRIYEGKTYGFCSDACAAEFDNDPIAYLPPSFPRPAPEIELRDLKGKPLKGLDGKVVLLDFWATWCAPCRKTMPELEALHRKYANRGFTVVGVSIDEAGPAKVKKFITSKKISYPIALDNDEKPAWEAYRVKAIPAAFLIDAKGQVVAQWLGAGAPTHEVEAKLAELLPKAD